MIWATFIACGLVQKQKIDTNQVKKKKNWKVNKEVAPPESKELDLVKIGLKSWKVGNGSTGN